MIRFKWAFVWSRLRQRDAVHDLKTPLDDLVKINSTQDIFTNSSIYTTKSYYEIKIIPTVTNINMFDQEHL